MKKKFIKLLLVTTLWLPCIALASLQTKTQELHQVDKKIHGLKSTLKNANSKKHNLEAELKSIEISMGHSTDVLRQTRKQLSNKKHILTHLNQQRNQFQQKLQTQEQALAKQIRASYMLGEHQYLKLLLSQDNPSNISRLLTYYHYINAARIKIIKKMQLTLHELTKNQLQIKKQSERYAELLEKQQRQKLLLNKRLHERKIVLARLNQNIKTKSEYLQQLQTNRKDLQNLITRLKKQHKALLHSKIPFSHLKGKLHWPTKGEISEDYGYRIGSSTYFHAVLISAPLGEPVLAVAAGKVVFANWLRGVGLLVIIQHNDHFMTLYGHNQSLLVKKGQYVAAGQEIATVGKTGGNDHTGLFFQIRKNGQPLNPHYWCQRETPHRA